MLKFRPTRVGIIDNKGTIERIEQGNYHISAYSAAVEAHTRNIIDFHISDTHWTVETEDGHKLPPIEVNEKDVYKFMKDVIMNYNDSKQRLIM